MPKVFDQRSGAQVGTLSADDLKLLIDLSEEPTSDEEGYPIDPEFVEQLAEAGGSENLLMLLRQVLEGRDGFDLRWEPD